MILHKKITVNAPVQQVFSYWVNFKNFQQLISMIEKIEILDDKKSRWEIHTPLGHKIFFESLITLIEPDKRLTWESSHADGYARGELRLIESGKNTLVELEFEYNLHRGWMQNIARIVNRFGFPSHTFDHGLAHIKNKIESDIKK